MRRGQAMMRFEVDGATSLRLKLSGMPRKLDSAIKTELNKIGLEIVTFIRLSMKNSPPDTTKSYRRTKAGLRHHPSYPYNFPRIDSGNLIRNITYHTTYRGLIAGDLNKTPYAIFLEEGTKYMEPRPFIKPTWEKFMPITENRIMDAIKRTL
jgi:HK97 gp10 family phage protein